ncbi:dithiol-disulfide isomerase involved in polyketide biosynthesis-like protein [Desulforamulus reducens MI-1]|uniref:Dithiol-disulfide isomerase involved in polyketide biosynthesis-like protein n=1 Tax=Desulforamulus reducens (strain ATCC BAA-1160 / DSM 100696 / MI-1) TaxID=349161 RepID=A4J7V9_DESRM|nr:dithiol-disulfide isomerase involved in polyketide biosynthesis-like protein [Desulforamulus reducens MI-1]
MSREYPLDITWVGYELRPERAAEGEKLSNILPGADLKQVFAHYNQAALEYGISINQVDFLPNTHMALMATEFAKDLDMFEEFHSLVFKSFFTEGRDIGNSKVVVDLLVSLNVPREKAAAILNDPVYSDRVKKNRNDAVNFVAGLPTFIIENKKKIVGAQPLNVFRNILDSYH